MAPLKISLSYLGETPKIDEEAEFFFSDAIHSLLVI